MSTPPNTLTSEQAAVLLYAAGPHYIKDAQSYLDNALEILVAAKTEEGMRLLTDHYNNQSGRAPIAPEPLTDEQLNGIALIVGKKLETLDKSREFKLYAMRPEDLARETSQMIEGALSMGQRSWGMASMHKRAVDEPEAVAALLDGVQGNATPPGTLGALEQKAESYADAIPKRTFRVEKGKLETLLKPRDHFARPSDSEKKSR